MIYVANTCYYSNYMTNNPQQFVEASDVPETAEEIEKRKRCRQQAKVAAIEAVRSTYHTYSIPTPTPYLLHTYHILTPYLLMWAELMGKIISNFFSNAKYLRGDIRRQ